MDSETSCTYEEFVSDYKSTSDSEMWSVHYIKDHDINFIFNADKVPVSLRDDTMEVETRSSTEIPTIGQIQMEEMLAEVIFSMPETCVSELQMIARQQKDSLFVSMSTYGFKYLAFKLPGCLLCESESQRALYVPQRLFKKVVLDCRIRGIECEITGSRYNDIYHRVFISSRFEKICESICMSSYAKTVSAALTPIYRDGFNRYYPVKCTMYMVLNPNRRVESPTGSGDTILLRDKRQIQISILNIEKS